MSARFRHPHRVTYADCTAGDHVYYARCLEWLEAARGAFFRSLGTSFAGLEAEGFHFPVRRCLLEYRSEARYDEELEIEVWIARAERVKLTFGYRITCGERLVLEGETLHGCLDAAGRPARLPEALTAAGEARP